MINLTYGGRQFRDIGPGVPKQIDGLAAGAGGMLEVVHADGKSSIVVTSGIEIVVDYVDE